MKTDAIEAVFSVAAAGALNFGRESELADVAQARRQLAALLEANREMREVLEQDARWRIYAVNPNGSLSEWCPAERTDLARYAGNPSYQIAPENESAHLLEKLERLESGEK